MWAIPTGTISVFKKKKKVPVRSRPSELGSDPPSGSDRESGCDNTRMILLYEKVQSTVNYL